MSSKMFVGPDGSPIENMKFSDANLAAAYSDWISHVKRSVPPEKLLVFNVKQGWQPLCTFLGLPGKVVYSPVCQRQFVQFPRAPFRE